MHTNACAQVHTDKGIASAVRKGNRRKTREIKHAWYGFDNKKATGLAMCRQPVAQCLYG